MRRTGFRVGAVDAGEQPGAAEQHAQARAALRVAPQRDLAQGEGYGYGYG